MPLRKHSIKATLLLCLLYIGLTGCSHNTSTGGNINTDRNINPIILAPITDWQHHVFTKKTDYTLQKHDQKDIIKATSHDSASMLYKKISINLNETPYLNWRWKINNTLGPLDETTRTGDDYPARIYIAITGQALLLQPKALNYVWSNSAEKLTHWKNAYNNRSIVIALESGNQHAGRWLAQKRNLKKDLATYLGHEIDFIDGIAIMTDTDNSNTQTTAYYADIFFSAQ